MQQSLDYTKCVFCEFTPTLGSDHANKPQMRDHYITKHYKEKGCEFLKLNKISNPPYFCHVKECLYSKKSVRDKIELLRHYARNHGMLESFYREEFDNQTLPEQNTVSQKSSKKSSIYTLCLKG